MSAGSVVAASCGVVGALVVMWVGYVLLAPLVASLVPEPAPEPEPVPVVQGIPA